MYDPHTDIMNEVYLKQAYIYASRSQDPSTQNGAILIHPEKGIVLGASNSLVEGSHDDVWSSERKYHYVEHAERNVLYKAARRGIPTVGLTLCCPWFACSDCARAIVQCGINKVIGHKKIYEFASPRWKESVEIGLDILERAGVTCVFWEKDVGEGLFTIRVNGEEFSP